MNKQVGEYLVFAAIACLLLTVGKGLLSCKPAETPTTAQQVNLGLCGLALEGCERRMVRQDGGSALEKYSSYEACAHSVDVMCGFADAGGQ